MGIRVVTILIALLLVSWSSAIAQTGAPSFDVAQLLREVQRAGDASSKRVYDYSWTSRVVVRWFNKSGRITKDIDQEYEAYPSPGLVFVLKKLVKDRGVPLSAKRRAKEQERVNAEMLQAQLAEARLASAPPPAKKDDGRCKDFGIWTTINGPGGKDKDASLGTSDFLCFGEFFAPHIERKEGRETVVLNFRPAPSLAPHSDEKKMFSKLVGVVWIDLEDKAVTHIEAWPVENPRAFTGEAFPFKNPAVIFDDMRLPAGMWVRRKVYIDTRKDPLAFNGLNLEWQQDLSDYTLYSALPKDYKLAEPKAPISPP